MKVGELQESPCILCDNLQRSISWLTPENMASLGRDMNVQRLRGE
jgi:hypothetical protein